MLFPPPGMDACSHFVRGVLGPGKRGEAPPSFSIEGIHAFF
jgi:hypothetical protein